ncbi:MAG: PDZ domain-containing protein [Acidobacteriota bacterium]
MINKDLQNNAEDEILSVGDVKIQQMIKNLPRIDAPKDFDFRLKARIANARPTEFQPRFLPVLRYILPLSVVVLIFTFVVINGVFFGRNNQTAEAVQQIPVESKTAQTNDLQTAPPEVAKIPAKPAPQSDLADSNFPKVEEKEKEKIPVEKTNLVAVKSQKKTQPELPKEKVIDNGGGSHDSAASYLRVITPNGIHVNDVVETSPNNEHKNDILTKQILLPLGIEIVSENGKRRVQSVKKGSIAERSGVKIGDLVEMIDGEKVSGDAVHNKTLQGKQITVLRGTEKVEITFDNQ